MEMNVSNVDNHLSKRKELLDGLTGVLDENKQICISFIRERALNGLSDSRQIAYSRLLYCLLGYLGQKPLKEATKDDVAGFLEGLKNKKYGDNRRHKDKGKSIAESTFCTYKFQLKTFYHAIFNMRENEYPPCVDWLKGNGHNKEMLPSALPTEEDIRKMAAMATNPRDKALCMVLAESGCRIQELLTRQIKHVDFDDMGAVILVGGVRGANKTGMRRVRICFAEPELKVWLNHHPQKNNPEAPLWVVFNGTHFGEPLKYVSAHWVIGQLKKRAGIDKRCNPHAFRHFAATCWAKEGFNESEMRIMGGWSRTSSMPSTYIHLSGADVDKKILIKRGKLIEGQSQGANNLKPENPCPRCNSINPVGFKFCGNCSFVLSDIKAVKIETDKKEANNMLNFISQHPDLSKEFMSLIDKAMDVKKELQST